MDVTSCHPFTSKVVIERVICPSNHLPTLISINHVSRIYSIFHQVRINSSFYIGFATLELRYASNNKVCPVPFRQGNMCCLRRSSLWTRRLILNHPFGLNIWWALGLTMLVARRVIFSNFHQVSTRLILVEYQLTKIPSQNRHEF